MKFKKLSFKNAASYGGEMQTIEFEENIGNLYLVLGPNGIGKTTIATMFAYGAYGQVEDLNLSDLPNRINKNLYVKLELSIGGQEIIIERGLKPKLFKVTVEGVELDQAGITNVQDYLEKELFQMPYKVFKNIIILSVNDFKSFLTMSPKDKRLIIDKLFGFSIINDMYDILKNERKDLQLDINNVNSELNTILESIKSTEEKLIELERSSNTEYSDKIKILKSTLLKLKDDSKKLENAKNNLLEVCTIIESEINKLTKEYNDNSNILNTNKNKLKLYENSKCPECAKPLDTDFDKNRKEELKKIIETVPEKLNKIESEIKNNRNKLSDNKLKQNKVIDKISEINANINYSKRELINISKLIKEGSGEFKSFKSLIDDFKINLDNKTSEKHKLSDEEYFLSVIDTMLGDSGIKNMAIRTILPGLNATIAMMVNEMHLKFQIRFDEKFNCIINHLGEDINPRTLSTGERKKADFIIIISFIKLLMLRFPNLNILFLDEIFSSIDQDGIYNILNILSKVIKEYKLNTFVINHTILPSELFDKKIDIYNENGFSKFKIENIK